MLRVLQISTFGPKIRGISPYSDSLTAALSQLDNIELNCADYTKPFPLFLLPNNTDYSAANEYAYIDYTKPSTWNVTKEKAYDVVHIQYWSPAFLPIILAITRNIKKKSIKVILTWHNPSPHEKFPLISILEKYLMSICDSIICHTEEGTKLLLKIYQHKSIHVVHHGCNIHENSDASAQDYSNCGLIRDNTYILYFGNIRPYKGVDILLDAWEMISSNHPKVKLIIAGRLWKSSDSTLSKLVHRISGTASYSETIRNKLDNSSTSVIRDIEFIPENKLTSYMKISDLAVFPYIKFDSQSGAASLAASYGIPILATGVGGLKDLVISNKFISKDFTAASLADLMENKLNNYQTTWKNEQLNKAKNHSWDLCAKMHLNIYKEISEN